MKSRLLLLLATAVLSVATAHAQLAVYGKLDVTHFRNNSNQASEWFYGPAVGIYDNFLHLGPVQLGGDLRGSYLTGSNDKYRSLLGGARLVVKPPLLPVRPYVEGLVGAAGTRSTRTGTFSTATSVSFSNSFHTKLAYQVLGGLDVTIFPHLDVRVAELGYGRVSPVSSAASTQSSSTASFSSGIVIRLF